jgi:hypothetical protein
MEYRREEWRNKERKKRERETVRGERREGKGVSALLGRTVFCPFISPIFQVRNWLKGVKLAKSCKIG